jgi:hypothetical protein
VSTGRRARVGDFRISPRPGGRLALAVAAPGWVIRLGSADEQRDRLLRELAQLEEEPGAVGTVEDPVIAG